MTHHAHPAQGQKRLLPNTPTGQHAFLSGPRVREVSRPLAAAGETLFGRYEVLRIICQNGRSAVFQVSDQARTETVALRLQGASCREEEQLAARMDELFEITHRLIGGAGFVQVHDWRLGKLQGERVVACAMEYAEGGSLRDWLQLHAEDVAIRRSAGLDFFRDLACAVAELHERGVLHLDVKPENVLFVRGCPKLTDWDTAVLKGEDNSSSDGHHAWQEGTIEYTSPDVIHASNGESLDERADIYSLGVVLHEILSANCRPPFTGSRRHVKSRQLGGIPPAIDALPRRLARVLGRALDKDRSRRYRTVDELLDDLDAPGPDDDELVNVDPEPSEECVPLRRELELRMSERDYATAQHICDLLLQQIPGDIQGRRMKSELEQRFDAALELYRAASQGADNASLKEQLGLVEEAASIYPEHPAGVAVQTRLQGRAETFITAMAQYEAHITQSDLVGALSCAEVALAANPGSSEARSLVATLSSTVNRERTLRTLIDSAVVQNDLDRATVFARELDDLRVRTPLNVGRLLPD